MKISLELILSTIALMLSIIIDELLHEAEYGSAVAVDVRNLLTTVLQAMNPLGLKN